MPIRRRNQFICMTSSLINSSMGSLKDPTIVSNISRLGFIGLCFLITVSHTYAQTTDNELDNAQSQEQTTGAISSEQGSENDSENSDAQTQQSSTEANQLEISTKQTENINTADVVFNIDVLIERMKGTNAIGVISKLSLKNQVDDLLEQASDIKVKESAEDLSQRKSALREEFEGLILKTVALLNKGEDFTLAEDIYLAREELWKSIMENKA